MQQVVVLQQPFLNITGFKILKFSSEEEGEVLSWGAAGAGRLGHGHKTSILGFSITTRYEPNYL